MKDKGFTFLLTRKNTGYDYTGRLSEYVKSERQQDYILAYISNLTKYASYVDYVSKMIECRSFFLCDQYVVFVRYYTKKDERFFVESEVTVFDLQKQPDFSEMIERESGSLKSIVNDLTFIDMFDRAVGLTSVSESTSMLILVDNQKTADAVRGSVFREFSAAFPYSSFIEAIQSEPSVQYKIALCHCVLPGDKDSFLKDYRERRSNTILVDLTGGSAYISTEIMKPELSQSVLKALSRGEKEPKSLLRFIAGQTDIIKGRKRGYLNYLAASYLIKHYPSTIPKVVASEKEKERLEQFYADGGLR